MNTDKNGVFVLRGNRREDPIRICCPQVASPRGALKADHPARDRYPESPISHSTPVTATLPAVTVTSKVNTAYYIDATEIAKHPVLDALDVVLNLRPRMLGDAYKECRPDTSHLTFRPPRLSHPSPAVGEPERRTRSDPPNSSVHQRRVAQRAGDEKHPLPNPRRRDRRDAVCGLPRHPSPILQSSGMSLFVIPLKPGAKY